MLTLQRSQMHQNGDGQWRITCGAAGIGSTDTLPTSIGVQEPGLPPVDYFIENRVQVNPMFYGFVYRARPVSRHARRAWFVLILDYDKEG